MNNMESVWHSEGKPGINTDGEGKSGRTGNNLTGQSSSRTKSDPERTEGKTLRLTHSALCA